MINIKKKKSNGNKSKMVKSKRNASKMINSENIGTRGT